MREIKFRGIDTCFGNWVYGSLQVCKNGKYIIHFLDGGNTEIRPETAGQFTGLYDKNGTPVYEGDFIKDEFFGNGEIVFFWEEWRVNYGDADIVSLHNELDDHLVIGNIHDNPELLNK